jgi:CBS domain-containing protein
MLTNKVREIMTKEVTTAPASSTIFDVMEAMVAKNVGYVILMDNQAPVGIFTDHDVLRRVMTRKLSTRTTSIKRVMSFPVRAVGEEARIVDVLGKMYRGGIRHMLVRGEKSGMVGLVSMRRIVDLAVKLGEGLPEARTIDSIMSRRVATVDGCRSSYDAIRTMLKKDACCVMVLVDGEPKGIFTSRDVLNRVAIKNIGTKTTPVKKVMTPDPVTVPHSAFVGEVLSKMSEGGYRHMPVRGHTGELVGLVTMANVLKYARAFDVDENVRKTWKEIEEFWESAEHYTAGN